MATPLAAATAYASVARIASESNALALARQPADGASGGDASFAAVLKEAIGSVAEMGRKSDAQARAAVNGKANIVDVVTAVSETEVAIDAVVAVRDRVIAAYEDIMKMPI
ncbi:MAG TPA: flagellar hook-basal body complex protein FliE [Pseudolabrys sp.]|nr:flagellar hook-basal body complex protein FliE [Pseudolabrys sp.]